MERCEIQKRLYSEKTICDINVGEFMKCQGMECERVNRIRLVQGKVQWQAIASTAMSAGYLVTS